ncbi:lipase lipl-3-like [Panonychus citri]|uniref:lipase lipl-3-like n=1 Tax=Panonychus citri TaxID=50023 RepID=UPI002307AA6D|nr:lipase lipl-3-like [Panonychus citri]
MSLATSTVKNTLTSDPDTYRTVPELLLSRGFSCDNHYVTTKDGTILHLFRIKSHFAQATLGNNSLHPVFLQHGFALSASSWLINSPGENVAPWVNKHKPLVTGNNLATFLANQGYDVWLGNNRGNQYSTNHTDMDAAHDDRFWKFSFDEHVEEDAPAMIDYILNITGKGKW